MKKIRLLLVKMIRLILVKMGRGGSLPGRLALKFDPSLFQRFQYPECLIVVTGTNGKTTTSNLIVESLMRSGLKVIGNRKGDNLREGIATLLIANCDLGYRINCDAIVLEVDELTVPRVFKQLPVTHFIINNLFRDQLDRSGEMETIIRKIAQVLDDYENTLILNANDPNVLRFKLYADKAKIKTFAICASPASSSFNDEASEGRFCPICQQGLEYDYYQYSHIGQFHCPNGDFSTGRADLYVSEIDEEKQLFKVDDEWIEMFQPSIYALYNCAAVLCLMKVLDLDFAAARETFKSFVMKDGRNETFMIHGYPTTLNLIKNPTGANEVMKAIVKDGRAKTVLIILNDNEQDGTDVSWIWDAHFELVMDENTTQIICSGTRAYDMALRVKYQGFQGELKVVENLQEAVDCCTSLQQVRYVIATYTALRSTRQLLRRLEG